MRYNKRPFFYPLQQKAQNRCDIEKDGSSVDTVVQMVREKKNVRLRPRQSLHFSCQDFPGFTLDSLQPGLTPCTSGGGGKGRKSMLLGSCIARTNSEEDLQQELATKRPISPGHRGTTWNGNPIKAITSRRLRSNADDMCLSESEMDDIICPTPPHHPIFAPRALLPLLKQRKECRDVPALSVFLTLIDLEQKTWGAGKKA